MSLESTRDSPEKNKDDATKEIFKWTTEWNRWFRFLLSHGRGFTVSEGSKREISLTCLDTFSGEKFSSRFIQAIIQIAGALYLGLQILKEEFPSSLAIASLVAGFLSVISGEFGQRRSRAPLLRFYSFFTVVATALSITVLAGGDLTLKDVKDVSISAATKKLEFLEAIRVLLGVPVQILAVKTAISLVSNMSPPKTSS